MFRRKEDTITPDASYPVNLKELGFFINKLGHIRMIEAPEKPFVFNSTNNDRHNEVRNEALHACLRTEVLDRLSKLGIRQLYFPQLTATKPNGPHIPILAPPLDVLKSRKRIVVLINDALQDLGILSYRQLQRELGLNGGSIINFGKELIKRSTVVDNVENQSTASSIFDDGTEVKDDKDVPGLVVMNVGQLLYSHKYNRAMTTRSWYALPRKSIAHDYIRIHEQENYVDGHRSATEHIKAVFDQLLCNPDRVAPDAEVYIVAIEGGADKVLEVFKEDFERYGARVAAMAVVHSLVDNSEIRHQRLKAFLHQRTRQWKYTDLTLTPTQCTELPEDYSGDVTTRTIAQDSKPTRWNEELSKPGSLSEITKTLYRLTLGGMPSPNGSESASAESDADSIPDWKGGSVLCPTFAGGKESTGECVFTEPKVQHAILAFFEEVAQDPENYRNPAFTTYSDVPHPTVDAPFALSADPTVQVNSDIQSAAPIMTPRQVEVDEARAKLTEMRIALDACPEDDNTFAKGRTKLVQKIEKQEAAVKELQVKALSSGSLGAGEAEDLRQDWSPKVDGHQVPFAGTMVDSELLKAAGLGETASEGLDKLDEEEKAFI